MNNLFTVFKYEYFGYVKSKTYIVITSLMVFLAIVVSTVPTAIGFFNASKANEEEIQYISDGKESVAIVDEAGFFSFEKPVSSLTGYKLEAAEKDKALEMLSKGELAFVLEIKNISEYNVYVGKMNLAGFDMMSIAGKAFKEMKERSYLEAKGFSEEDITGFKNISVSGNLISVDIAGAEGETMDSSKYTQKIIYAYVLLFFLYFALLMYGQYIVISVVSEKSTKAMELLITSTKPANLMFGKVFGVGTAGLTQFSLMLICAFASYKVNSMIWETAGLADTSEIGSIFASFLSPVSPSVIIFMTLFFIFGFFIYAFLYAGFASTASRMEEANTVSVVPMMLIILSFFVAMFGLTNPGGTMVTICSYIPFMSPMVMFMRICTDSVSTAGAVISVVILILSVFLAGIFSSKIYRVCVLMYGKPPKLIDIIKLFIKARV